MEPTVLMFPPVVPFTCQVTPRFPVPVTIAANCCVALVAMLGVSGDTATAVTTGVIVTLDIADFVGSATLVTVTATSVADPTKSAMSSVTITPVVTAVAVSPLTPSIATNATQQFAAMVTGTGNLGVTWQVNGTTGGNINTVGSISPSGFYTAPSFTVVTMAAMFTITAVSVQNPGVSGSTTITVTPPPITVSVSPDPVTVTASQMQQFTVVVTNAANPAVTWSVVG